MMINSQTYRGWRLLFSILLLMSDSFAQDVNNQTQEETTTIDSISELDNLDLKVQTEATSVSYEAETITDLNELSSSSDMPPTDQTLLDGEEENVLTPISLEDNITLKPPEEIPELESGIANEPVSVKDDAELHVEPSSNLTFKEPNHPSLLDEKYLLQRIGEVDVTTPSSFEHSGKMDSPHENTVLPMNLEEFSRAALDAWKPVWPFPQMNSLSMKPTVRFPSIFLPFTKLNPTTITPGSLQYTIPKEPVTAYYFDIASAAPTPSHGPLHDPSLFVESQNRPEAPGFRFPEDDYDFKQDLSHLESSIDDQVRNPDQDLPPAVETTPVFRLPTALRTTPTRTVQQFENTLLPTTEIQPSSIHVNNEELEPSDISAFYDWTAPRISNTTTTYTLANSSDFQFDHNDDIHKENSSISNTEPITSSPTFTSPPPAVAAEKEEPNYATGDLSTISVTPNSLNASLTPTLFSTPNTPTEQSPSTNTTSSLSRIPLWQRISDKISTQPSVTNSFIDEFPLPVTPSSNSHPFENDIPIGIFSPSINVVPGNGKKDNDIKINNFEDATPNDEKFSSSVPFLESSLLSTTTTTTPKSNIKPYTNIYDVSISNDLDDLVDAAIFEDANLNVMTDAKLDNNLTLTTTLPVTSVDNKSNQVSSPSISTLVSHSSLSDSVHNLITPVEDTAHIAPTAVSQPNSSKSKESTDFVNIVEEDALKVRPDFMFGVTIEPTPLLPYDEGAYLNYDFGDDISSSNKPYEFVPISPKIVTPPKDDPSIINSHKNEVYEASDDQTVYDDEDINPFDSNFDKDFPYGSNLQPKPEDSDKPSLATDTDVPLLSSDSDLENNLEGVRLPTTKAPNTIGFPEEIPVTELTTLSSTTEPTTTPLPSTTTSTSTTTNTPESSPYVPPFVEKTTTSTTTTTEKPEQRSTEVNNNSPSETEKSLFQPTIRFTTTEKPRTNEDETVFAIVDDNPGFEPNLHIVKIHQDGTNSTHPSPFVKAAVSYDIRQFCEHKRNIHALLREWINVHVANDTNSTPYEIEVFYQPDCKNMYLFKDDSDDSFENRTDVYFYVKQNGIINPNVTLHFPKNPTTLEISQELDYLKRKILHLELVNAVPSEGNLLLEEAAVGTWIIAIVIVTSLLLVLLVAAFLAFFVIKRRKSAENLHGRRCTPANDAYSLDSVSMFYHSIRRKTRKRASNKSLKSYLNHAFDDPNGPSYPLTFAKLTHHISDIEGIHDEFTKIPFISVKYDEMPRGVEDKNRYANVIPVSETRILLNNNSPYTEYINANSIHGPKGELRYFIATQAPLDDTVADFWQMVWEQESKVIVMLTDFVEKGIDKCADYLPPSETLDCHRVYGEFQITLKSRDLREKYVVSIVQIKNLENNLVREIAHMWFTGWPHSGVPSEEKNFISFIFDVRTTRKQLRAKGPIVVHCSPGTGRTGTYIACDLVMRQFDDQKVVDIPKTVFRIRKERAGAVQTKDQYAFIYRVVNMYAAKLTTGNLDSF